MGKAHGVGSDVRVDAAGAESIASVMATLSTASRIRILTCLRGGPCTVGELTEAVEMSQPAVSQQLRVLRDAGLVVGSRDGRSVVYELYDPHLASLLDEALRHVAHLNHNR